MIGSMLTDDVLNIVRCSFIRISISNNILNGRNVRKKKIHGVVPFLAVFLQQFSPILHSDKEIGDTTSRYSHNPAAAGAVVPVKW